MFENISSGIGISRTVSIPSSLSMFGHNLLNDDFAAGCFIWLVWDWDKWRIWWEKIKEEGYSQKAKKIIMCLIVKLFYGHDKLGVRNTAKINKIV